MSLYEFISRVDGWNMAQGGRPEPEVPSADDMRERAERVRKQNG